MKRKLFKIGILVFILVIPILFFIVTHLTGENYYDLPKFVSTGVKEYKVDGKIIRDSVYHSIEKFELIDEKGEVFNSKSFSDKISVVSFITTTGCEDCRKVMGELVKLESIFEGDEDVRIYSLTVIPEKETVQVLSDFKFKYEINGDQWKFLTCKQKPLMDDIIRNQFFIKDPSQDGVIKTTKVVLLDKDRVIRGYYDGTDGQSIDDMISGIQILKENYARR